MMNAYAENIAFKYADKIVLRDVEEENTPQIKHLLSRGYEPLFKWATPKPTQMIRFKKLVTAVQSITEMNTK